MEIHGTTAYVSNELSNNVNVIDINSRAILATIPVSTEPEQLAFTPNGAEVYVVCDLGEAVNVINTSTFAVTHTISLEGGSGPEYLAISADGTRVFVPAFFHDNVGVIDTSLHIFIATVSSGGSGPLSPPLITPDGKQLYVINFFDNTVGVIDMTTNTVITSLGVGLTPGFGAALAGFAPQAPEDLVGHQERNRFFSQIELFNVISWNTPALGTPPVHYRIYRDAALTDLIAAVPANASLKFEDHNRKKNQVYTYFVVSVSETGLVSQASSVTVFP